MMKSNESTYAYVLQGRVKIRGQIDYRYLLRWMYSQSINLLMVFQVLKWRGLILSDYIYLTLTGNMPPSRGWYINRTLTSQSFLRDQNSRQITQKLFTGSYLLWLNIVHS